MMYMFSKNLQFMTAPRRKILRSASWLLVYKIALIVNSFVMGVWIARYLGPERFGILSYAISLAALVTPLTSLGLNDLTTKEVKTDPDNAHAILANIIVLRVCGTLIATIIIYYVSQIQGVDFPNIGILCTILVGATIFESVNSVKSVFLAQQNPKPYVIVASIVLLAFSIIRIVLIVFNLSVSEFILAAAAESACSGIAIWILYHFRTSGSGQWTVNRRLLRRYLLSSPPFILSSLTAVIYLKSDIVLLAYLTSEGETGIYAVAARISQIWYMVPALIVMGAFPRFLEVRLESRQRYLQRVQDALDGMAALATVVAVCVTLLAEPLILVLFGEAYLGAAALVSLHIWGGVFVALRNVVRAWLIAEDLYWLSAWLHAAGAVLNIILNLALIPIYGATGAAVATVVSLGAASIGVGLLSAEARPISLMMIRSLFWPRRLAELWRAGMR